jgi:cobalt-zinc-cadmium efflux system membrane fusion protein
MFSNAISKKQFLAIVLIIILGVVLSIFILNIDKSMPEDEESQAEAKPLVKQDPDVPTPSEEGKIALTDEQIKENGISIQTVASAHIKSIVTLPGEIRFNEDKTSHVVPRLAGVVESVSVNLGQPVKKGQVLAVIASTGLTDYRSELLTAQKRLDLARVTYERQKKLSDEGILARKDYLQAQQAMREMEVVVHNAQQKLIALGTSPNISTDANALNRFEIRAPFDGMVVDKHLALGEAVKEDANIFTISDLSSVWAEMIVSAKDLGVVMVGKSVTVKATAFDSQATGTVSYVGSLMGEQTRTAKARAVLANPQMAWRPGLFITVELVDKETEVPTAVSSDAIQTINDKPTVFIRVSDGFIAQAVTTGLSDGKVTEIVQGLKSGTQYAANGSFVIKAEQGKSSVEED